MVDKVFKGEPVHQTPEAESGSSPLLTLRQIKDQLSATGRKRTYTKAAVGVEARADHVILQLKIALEDCYYGHPKMTAAVKEIVAVIKKKKIAFAKDNQTSGYAHGYISTSRLIAKIVDPAIQDIYPSGSFIDSEFMKSGYPLPLSDHIEDIDSYHQIADLVGSVGDAYAEFCWNGDENEVYESTCATMGLLMDVVRGLASIAPVAPELKWCGVCFRQHPCAEHRSNKDLPNPEYESGRKIKKALPLNVIKEWEKHRAQRRLLGEKFEIMSFIAKVPDTIEFNSLLVDPNLHELINNTVTRSWKAIAPSWKVFIQNNFPIVSNLILPDPIEFSSWEVYVNHIKADLNNHRERTSHPLWIIYMLREAEDWFCAKKNLTDHRTTDTLEQILKIYPSETTNKSEVARRLKLSREAVRKALSLHMLAQK